MANDFLKRYLDGEHKAVWAELFALGPRVRDEPYFEPARAVCREMTRRSRLNLVLLINRLCELNFQFWSRAEPPHLVRLYPDGHDRWRQEGLWVPPADICQDTAGRLDHCEKNGVFIPLAVRVWMEDIGLVSLAGRHPALCPFYDDWEHPQVYADPFEIQPVADLVNDSMENLPVGISYIHVSADDSYKSELGIEIHTHQDRSYSIRYPDAAIDADLNGVWFPATFVGYLRKSFQWGGFPGWERYPNRPEKELAFLRDGLLPI